MIRIVPTPERASREATADPVAPHPTIATRAAASLRWPSTPTPRNKICLEYRSSSSKDITNPGPRNLYYKSRGRCLIAGRTRGGALFKSPGRKTGEAPAQSGLADIRSVRSRRGGFAVSYANDKPHRTASVRVLYNAAFPRFIETVSHPEAGRGPFLRAAAVWCVIVGVSLLPARAPAQQVPTHGPALSQQTPTSSESPPQSPSPLGPVSAYLDLPVREIRFSGVAEREKDHLRQLLPQKVGQPLNRDSIRDSVKVLYDSGLFADIQVQAEKADDQVILTFATVNNYFIGSVNVEGDPGRPSANQIISATKFQLGEVYTQEKLDRAQKNILQLMSDNGFYRASLTHDERLHPETDQVDVVFRVKPGAPAQIG